MSIVINKNDWKYYLTRPFNLFEASIWHEWYRSDLMKELVGMKLSCGLYLEYPVNNARSYKKPSEIDHYMKLASDVALDREKSLKILADAEALNEKAKKFLAGELTFSFEESIKFLNLLVIYSILPYYIGNGRTDDKEILEKVNRLRSISFYPKILEKIVIPAAENKIIEQCKQHNIQSGRYFGCCQY